MHKDDLTLASYRTFKWWYASLWGNPACWGVGPIRRWYRTTYWEMEMMLMSGPAFWYWGTNRKSVWENITEGLER